MRPVVGQRVVGRRQQVGLARRRTRRRGRARHRAASPACRTASSCRPARRHGLRAELAAGRPRRRPASARRDRADRCRSSTSANVGGGMQLGDQPLRADSRMPIDEVSTTADQAPVHARTVATCCNRPHGRPDAAGLRRIHTAGPGGCTSTRAGSPSSTPTPSDLDGVLGARQHHHQPGRRRHRRRHSRAGWPAPATGGSSACCANSPTSSSSARAPSATENYSGAQLTVAQRQARQRRGQSEVPPHRHGHPVRAPRPRHARCSPAPRCRR